MVSLLEHQLTVNTTNDVTQARNFYLGLVASDPAVFGAKLQLMEGLIMIKLRIALLITVK